jgi:hypothetical protein
MAEHPDVERHRKGHDAFRSGDMEYMTEIIAEDTVWHWSGRSPISGEHVGRDAVFAVFGKLADLAGESMELEDHDFLGNDDHTVALGTTRASRGDRSLDVNHVEVCHWRDGKIVEEWWIIEDQAAADEFWS